MKTNEMTPEQSLQIISDAITKSRRDFEKNSGTPMITWGVIVLVFSFIVWIPLRMTGNPLWNFLWFAIPVVGVIVSLFKSKRTEIQGARNFINETIGQVWIGYGIFATVTALVLAFVAPQHIGTIIMSLLGYGTFMTGRLLKNAYITAGGMITGIGGTALLLLLETYDATLIFAGAALLCLILPGIMMNRKAR